jgi:multiple sugar transport system permease protein
MLGRALFLNGTGLVDTIIGAAGVGSTKTFWLVGGRAFWAMLAMEVWAVWPFMYIMVLSGLSSIPTDLYEAAAIDGASRWAVIRYVVAPGLRNVLLLGVLLSTIFHLGNFTLPFVMFNTPPPLSVDVLPVSIFFNAFVENQYSLGAAIAVFMVVVVFIPGIVYVRMSRLGRNGADT